MIRKAGCALLCCVWCGVLIGVARVALCGAMPSLAFHPLYQPLTCCIAIARLSACHCAVCAVLCGRFYMAGVAWLDDLAIEY